MKKDEWKENERGKEKDWYYTKISTFHKFYPLISSPLIYFHLKHILNVEKIIIPPFDNQKKAWIVFETKLNESIQNFKFSIRLIGSYRLQPCLEGQRF
jgi:hypothetical protein